MKRTFSALLPLLAPASAVGAVFRPQRISYNDLMSGEASMKSSFVDALSTAGMISITGIPNMNYKEETMAALHECASKSKATEEHKFPDGTRRLTMATHSLAGFVGKIDHGAPSEACDSFNQAGASFRTTVATVTQGFADRLADFFDLEGGEEPLLSTTENFPFHTLAKVVENGEHLEHFHSYQKIEASKAEETIEMHTDQGLFIAFTPGKLLDHQGTDSKGALSSGFFIEEQDGTVSEVAFEEDDDLVFMLGDGVNQYVNDRLSTKTLRAVPHTLLMTPHSESQTRVWYGLMVLPPVDAVHPAHDMTFGELRESMIDTSLKHQGEEKPGLGCSGSKVARDLSATTCEGDSIYCWHRCMSAADHDTSLEECTSQGLELLCTNPRRQIESTGDQHGDYFPACADSATQEEATPYPTLPEYPRTEEACTDELFKAYADSSGYEHSYDLEGNATFMWSVEDDAVKGRIVYNGLFGYIAFGFADVDGKKNGMHGATIIMALPGGNYSAVTGLDLTLDPTIEEYVIDPTLSAFRHWMTPVTATTATTRSAGESGVTPYAVDFTDCFTSMTFKTASIHDKSFDLSGSDELIWGANGKDFYAGYHGPSRGRFAINWPTGELSVASVDPETETAGTSGSTSAAVVPKNTLALSLLGLIVILTTLI